MQHVDKIRLDMVSLAIFSCTCEVGPVPSVSLAAEFSVYVKYYELIKNINWFQVDGMSSEEQKPGSFDNTFTVTVVFTVLVLV